MDATQVNQIVRQYLKFDSINDQVDLDLPVFHRGYWYVIVLSDETVLGAIVIDDDGTIITEQSLSLQELLDALPTNNN